MTDDSRTNALDRKKQLWAAGFGLCVFVGSGLLLAPGLVGLRERRPEPPPAALESTSTHQAASTPVTGYSGPGDLAFAGPPMGSVEGGRHFDCMLAPNEVIDIGSAITGRIEELHVERSDIVTAGQVLVKLDAGVEEAAVRVAEARADRDVDIAASEASLDLDMKREARARRLYETNALSLDQRQEVEARAQLSSIELERAIEDNRLASLQLDQALATLDRRTIQSPVDGIVVERLMSAGEVVDEETILRIAQVDPLRVETLLPSSWFGRIEPGDRAEIFAEGHSDDLRTADVVIVDRIIDGASGTFGVRLRLANPSHDLPAGLRCQVRFPEAEEKAAKAAKRASEAGAG